MRIRDNKTAAQADTLDTARAIFEAQVETGHRESVTAEAEVALEAPQLKLFSAK